eukprot:3284975-Prymnesium_polylepis.1
MLGGGAGGGPRPEPRRLTAACWPVRAPGLNEPFTHARTYVYEPFTQRNAIRGSDTDGSECSRASDA